MPDVSKAVLITGCSTGIGRATALRLARSGWTVYATARRPESIADLADAGCRTLTLDVTDEASMQAAVQAVEQAEGAVGVLVNNAGYSQSGAIEQISPEAVRRQFETNVFGAIRLAQLALPGMRGQRWGKIVNVGSMGGRMTFPGGGLYHATKYALEALSDVLRFEVRGFGVDVVLIEPGLITTEFAQNSVATVPTGARSAGDAQPSEGAERHGATPSAEVAERGGATDSEVGGAGIAERYDEFNARVAAVTVGVYESPMRHLGGGPDVVAKAIEKAITRRRTPTRVPVTPSARLAIFNRRLLSDRTWDAVLRSRYPEPR
ncbi:MAG TPA: SDR family NAD(P)-dependent oxidoreductase [Solirubrobacteraceae bacterium]|jgi:NAD(P)-dependent dehydrogenase (short-subunit alcohol dehydrogenase family)|nr:SDR family NAD(P)-dependent oxidoreductase [Solirubrobacteraceae bacterium]